MYSTIKLTKSVLGLTALLLILYSYSSGPGASGQRVAGSPVDQGTCVNCHTSHPLNSGSGFISISGISQYTPGNTYNLTVTVSGSSINRHGFQLVALVESNNNNAGTLVAGSGQHVVTLQGHDYIEHSTPSATGVFNFTWTAPATNVGNIIFYTAGNAAENPQSSPLGDYIYSTNLKITPPPVPPTANFGADTTTTCTGNQIVFTDSSTGTINSWSWNFGSGASPATSSLQIPPPVFYTSSGLKTVSLTVSGSAGSDTLTRTDYISVNQSPTVTLFASNDSICIGDSATITASGASTYSWAPGTGLSATSGSVVKASPAITTLYTVTGSTADNCTDQAFIRLYVLPLPSFTVSGAPSICQGDFTTLTAASSQILQYQWSPATGLSCTNCASTIATPTTTTTYTVTGTNALGCTKTKTFTLQVNPLPPVVASTPEDSVCMGNSTTLHASGASSYTWSPSSGLSCTSCADPIATPSVTTVYTVIGINANWCANVDSVSVTVLPLPVVSAGNDVIICAGTSTSLSASGAISYQWTPATGLSCTNCPNPIASPLTTTIYTVTGSAANGCTNTDMVSVTINPLPSITITADDTICEGQFVNLNATGGSVYSWLPVAGLNCPFCSNPVANPTVSTTYTVTVTDGNNCVNTDSVHIEVEPAINLTLTPSGSICAGSSMQLTASGASTYQWSPAGGLSGTTGSSVTASPTTTTTYTVTAFPVNGSCTATASVTVTVNSQPQVNIIPSSAVICPGETILLTASGATNYSWSPAASLNTAVGDSVYASPASTTNYMIVGDNGNGCFDSTTVLVQVNASLNVVVSPATDSICQGDATVLTASGATTYSWSPPGGLNTTTGAIVTASPTTSTIYTVIGAGGSGACMDTTTVEITVFPKPNLTLQPSSASICQGDTILLTASGAIIYQWIPSSGLDIDVGDSVYASPTTTTTYTVIATDSNGCSDTNTITINVLPLPIVTLTQSGDTLTATSGFSQYNWYLNGILDTTTNSGTIIVHQSGSWQVFVTGTNGCTGSSNTLLITGIESALSQNISIYPNPADQRVYVEMEHFTPGITISLIDITGMMQKIYRPLSSRFSLDISELAAGMYIITIKDNNSMKTSSLIVQ